MAARSWSTMLVRRATTAFALLALLQALLPGWHRLEHAAPAVAIAHACDHHHPVPAGATAPASDDRPDDDHHHDCPLCVALQAGAHADLIAPAPAPALVATAGRALATPPVADHRRTVARWTPPARGPPRRS